MTSFTAYSNRSSDYNFLVVVLLLCVVFFQANFSITTTYDSLDNILSIAAPENTGLTYSYDQRGNKRTYTDATNQSTTYQYDAHNRLTQITYPDGRGHGFSSYDGNHNLLAESDPSGSVRSYTYDGLNREITKSVTPATGFEESVTQVTTAYDGNGNKLQVSETGSHGGTATYIYDKFDRLIKQTDQNGKTIHYAYDNNGNRISLTSAFQQIAYRFDGLNRVKQVISDGQTTQYHYFQDSQLKSIQYPSGVTANYLYNPAGFLQSIFNTQTGSEISSVEYLYDLNGNRTQQIHNNGTLSITYTYEYDDADRLTQETRNSSNTVVSSYSYDSNSNRSSEMVTVDGTQSKNLTYDYDSNNRLTSIINNIDATQNISYNYDANGNRITKTKNGETSEYRYNAEDQLVRVEENQSILASFVYDHQGLRIKKTTEESTSHYVYDDQSVLYQTNESGALQAKYTYGLNQLISITEPGEQQQYYLFDGLGSPITLTQASGQVTARYSYDAFGNKIQESGNSYNRFAFTGHEEDKETNLIYMKARYYDADCGCFLTEDNFGGFPDKPPSLNKYLYAYGNPGIYVDPDGNIAFLANAAEGIKVFRENSANAAAQMNTKAEKIAGTTAGIGQMLSGVAESATRAVNFTANSVVTTISPKSELGKASQAELNDSIDSIVETGKAIKRFGDRVVADPSGTVKMASDATAAFGEKLRQGDPKALNQLSEGISGVLLGGAAARGVAGLGKGTKVVESVPSTGSGTTVYRQGTFADNSTDWEGNYIKGRQWAKENPLATQDYAKKYGLPAENTNSADWVVKGRIETGYSTRPAPASHNNRANIGGGTELIPNKPDDVKLHWFHMRD